MRHILGKALFLTLLATTMVIAHGQNPPGGSPSPPDLARENLEDRVSGTYAFECNGYRVDGPAGEVLDWTLRKDQMGYVIYGITSHTVIQAINEFYAGIGDRSLKSSGVRPDGMPVEGVNR